MLIKDVLSRVLYKINPAYHMGINNSQKLYELSEKILDICSTLKSLKEQANFLHTHLARQSATIDSINDLIETQNTEIKSIINYTQNHNTLLGTLLGENYYVNRENENSSEDDYIQMQRTHYEDTAIPSSDIVGQYNWHEKFPYETFLLYKYGDIRYPIFSSYENKKALDFGCGPGRMIKRMSHFFQQVDGCDISSRLLKEAKVNAPNSNFFLTNGNDLGNVPKNFYDFIYCTISMQHIASHTIRMKIIEKMYESLKENGCINLQMAYNPSFPYVYKLSQNIINDKQIITKVRLNQADYLSDDFNAAQTNGGHDVGIGKKDLEILKRDLEKYFSNVCYWFANVEDYYENLQGETHCNYWATSWIFIYGEKTLHEI